MKFFGGVVVLFFAMSCASSVDKTIKRNDKAQDVVTSGQGLGQICGNEAEAVHLNPRLITIKDTGGATFKLCNIMQAEFNNSQVKTAIFQFTNSDCLGCEEEAREITHYITSNNLIGKVKHYVVFVDTSVATMPKINEVMTLHAKQGVRLVDTDGAAAKIIFGTRDTVFPMALIMNNQGAYDIKFFEDKSKTVLTMAASMLSTAK